MTITGLLGFYVLRAALSFVLPPISHLPFYILVALFIYTIKVSVDIFMLSAYKSKTTFSIAFFLNLFYIFLALALGKLFLYIKEPYKEFTTNELLWLRPTTLNLFRLS